MGGGGGGRGAWVFKKGRGRWLGEGAREARGSRTPGGVRRRGSSRSGGGVRAREREAGRWAGPGWLGRLGLGPGGGGGAIFFLKEQNELKKIPNEL